MKKLIAIFVIIPLIIITGIIAYNIHLNTTGPEVMFKVRSGDTGSYIANRLKSEGIIKSPFWFKLLLKMQRKANALKQGTFKLHKNMASEKVIWTLLNTDGRVYVSVTLLEGWRLEEIANALHRKNIVNKDVFLEAAREQNLEGYLFPSTYNFEEETPVKTVIKVMTDEFNRRVKPLFKQYPLPEGLTEHDVLTIASIVEREAVYHEERPMIAAVYLNRIKIKMALEADPTVQYAIGYSDKEKRWWKKGLTYADLRFDSPYNTYRYKGIPPGPICAPSAPSIEAVLYPAEIDSLFFVADTTGKHTFNVTYKDHLKAVKVMKDRLRQKRVANSKRNTKKPASTAKAANKPSAVKATTTKPAQAKTTAAKPAASAAVTQVKKADAAAKPAAAASAAKTGTSAPASAPKTETTKPAESASKTQPAQTAANTAK